MDKKLCFIGGGNMAQCMIQGLIMSGFPTNNISVTAKTDETIKRLTNIGKITAVKDNVAAVKGADIIFLTVKPKIIKEVAEQIVPVLTKEAIIISVAAGVQLSSLEQWFGEKRAIIRCMPNTPAKICQGISGLFANKYATKDCIVSVELILKLIGKIVWLENESEMHVFTAIGGCSPAYVFLLIESMQQAVIKEGVSTEQAKTLVAQTILGASALYLSSREDPSVLLKEVCSPGGITEQGVNYFVDNNFSDIVQAAIGITVNLSKSMK